MELQRLLAKHHAMLDLSLAGLSHKAIAEQLNITTQTVSNVTNSTLFQEAMARRRTSLDNRIDHQLSSTIEQARLALEAEAMNAAEVQIDLLISEDERVRQTAATSILDRVGIGKKDDGVASVVVLDVDLSQNLLIAMNETFGKRGEEPDGVKTLELNAAE